MDVPARRPSPYSLQPSEPPVRSTSPELKSVPPRERLSPPIGESSLFIPGSGTRGYALPRDGSSVQPPQQNSAMSFTPAASRYELEIRKKVPESSYASQLNIIGDRDPPPYSERFSNDAPVGHDVVELHEADQFFGISQPPQAIQTMVKMVTMLNFMKVELGDQKTLRDKEQWRAAAAEFLGTMMFVYLGCGSVVASGMISPNMTCARLVAIALAHGLAICFLAGATGAISGGHLNPAVTLAFVVAGKETLIRAGLYVGAQALLSAASKSTSIAPALQNAAVHHLDAPVVPYPIVRDLWVQLTPAYGVPFHQVLAGSSFVLEAPKPREKSKELKERLAKLQEIAEQNAYKELVKDITKHDGDGNLEYFSSYKNSLGFGVHVVAIMFTGYMFGYAIFRAQFQNSPSMHAAGGVLGLIAGMFVETILFIVRDSLEEKNMKVKLQTKEKLKPLLSTPTDVMVIPTAQPDTAASGVRQRRSHTEAPG